MSEKTSGPLPRSAYEAAAEAVLTDLFNLKLLKLLKRDKSRCMRTAVARGSITV